MRRGKKIQTAAIGMLCLTTLTTGACVTQSTYDTAAADLEAVKAELRSTSTETQELTQQVSDLQQRQIGLARQRVVASSALKQARKADEGRAYRITNTVEQTQSHDQAPDRPSRRACGTDSNVQPKSRPGCNQPWNTIRPNRVR